MKESVSWTSSQLTIRLLNLKIAQRKRKPIAFNSPLVMLKLTQNQVRKCTIKKVKRFVGKCASHSPKTIVLSFAIRELLTFKYVELNRSHLGPLIVTFCQGRIELTIMALQNVYFYTVP